MLLSELLRKISYESVLCFSEREIICATDKASEGDEGCIFVCIRGCVHDGTEFVCEARKRGVRTFLSDRSFKLLEGETLIISPSPRRAIAELSAALYFPNAQDMKIIGVTGTKGKTTVSSMIFECLRELFPSAVLIGTLGARSFGIDMEDEEYENTTPDAKNIYRTLGEAYSLGARAAVIEVSSQAVAQERIFGIPFKALVFTNFSPDHIGFGEHLDIDEYYSAKKRLFFENSSALAVVNSDDERALDISSASEGVITVGTDRGADFYIGNISSDCRGVEFNLCGVPFSLPFGGRYNAYNAALAAALLREVFSLDLVRCSSRLRSVRVRGRYESYSLSGRTVIIDFAHNAESFRAICESARSVCRGSLILVFGSVGGRSFLRRRELAEAAELYADISVITSDNPGDEAPLKICNDIYSAFSDKSRAVIVIDRAEAIRRALSLSAEGDFILLLGKGHEEYQKISGKRVRFSEREIIKSLGASEMF